MVSAGCVSVLAHPFTLFLEFEDLERFVDALIEAGLKGIEGYHGDLPEVEQEPFRALGRSKNLIVSGGSDYHGNMRPDRGMPGGKHNVICPDSVLEEIREAASSLQAARN
jgi:predicted metal-dependent phosphoesterase TrpH